VECTFYALPDGDTNLSVHFPPYIKAHAISGLCYSPPMCEVA